MGKIIRYIILGSVLFITTGIRSQQSVAYTYDANGNRDSRYFVGLRAINPDFGGKDSTAATQKELAMSYGVSVYPNPTKDALSIDMNNSDKNPADLAKTDIYLIDNSGKIIAKKQYGSQASFDMSSYLPGVYYLDIRFNKKEVLNYKIVKVN